MLAVANRLSHRSEFAAAVRTGHRSGKGSLVVHLLRSEHTAPPRIGFVVGKAVGAAHQRNLVKRRLRHLVRERMELLPTGSSLVVRALPSASDRTYLALGADLDRALRRALA